MTRLPLAKTTDIVVQSLEDELLIYFTKTNRALCLNRTCANVLNACDGIKSFDNLKQEHGYTDGLIYLTLDELRKNNLISGNYVSPFAGMSRREAVRKVGLATMVALPVISGLIAPSAAQAASGTVCGVSCTSSSFDCASPCPTCKGTGSCVIGTFGTRSGSCNTIGSSCSTNGTCIGGFCSNDGSVSCRSSSRCTNLDGICGGTGTCQA